MSLSGMMRTSVSGMQAQGTRLSAVADNIANSDTTGYKRYSVEFSQLVRPGVTALNGAGGESGGVLSDMRQSVSVQGSLRYTQSATDLAVNGSGFFVVQATSGAPFLTRAGSFVPDDEGRLVNSSGLYLTGYDTANGAPAAVANGFGGLVPIRIDQADLTASPTTLGTFAANLPSADDAVGGNTPSSNAASSEWNAKTSLVTYDNLGGVRLVDLYFSKTGTGEWEVAAFDQADAAPGTGFPYAAGPLSTTTLLFDGTTGKLTAASADSLTFTVPDGAPTTLDLTGMTQLATGYVVSDATVNGNAPEPISDVTIDESGQLFARYGDGTFRSLYRIPLASVVSPDNLDARTGSVFQISADSGDVQIGFPGEGPNGVVLAGALEQSNVDIGEELTTMIQAQRGYTANSKVFQTGSELLDVLVNLKR